MKKLSLDKLIRHSTFQSTIIVLVFIFLFLGYRNLWEINFGESYFKELSFSVNISTKLFASFVCIVIFYHLRERIFFVLAALMLLEFYYRFDVRTHYDCADTICNANYIYPVINLYMIFFNYFLILILRLEKNQMVSKVFRISTGFLLVLFLASLVLHEDHLYLLDKVIYSGFISFHVLAASYALFIGRTNSVYYVLYIVTELPSFLNIFYNVNIVSGSESFHVPLWIGHFRNFLLISGSFQRMNLLRKEFDKLKEDEATKKIVLATDRARRKEIELENIRLESQVLKNELNPHFLFNCLNNVDYFMMVNVKKAKRILNLVSTLYRDSLILSKRTTIPLQQELDFLEKYLKLEKVRYGKKLQYEFNVQVNAEQVFIPSLILQILVENAIKHGISRLKEAGGAIVISISAHRNEFLCQISNPYEENQVKLAQEPLSSKTGLENTRKRLDILYKGKSHFSYEKRPDSVVVSFEFSGKQL